MASGTASLADRSGGRVEDHVVRHLLQVVGRGSRHFPRRARGRIASSTRRRAAGAGARESGLGLLRGIVRGQRRRYRFPPSRRRAGSPGAHPRRRPDPRSRPPVPTSAPGRQAGGGGSAAEVRLDDDHLFPGSRERNAETGDDRCLAFVRRARWSRRASVPQGRTTRTGSSPAGCRGPRLPCSGRGACRPTKTVGGLPRTPFGRVPMTGAPNHSSASRRLRIRSSRLSRAKPKINPSARPSAAANPIVFTGCGETRSASRCGGS